MFTVPSSIQAEPVTGLKDIPLKLNEYAPLNSDPKREELRAYHARLDLMQAMLNREPADLEWQVEKIIDWTTKSTKLGSQIMIKLAWMGGDKQWMTLEDVKLHDPHLLIRYTLKHKLTEQPG